MTEVVSFCPALFIAIQVKIDLRADSRREQQLSGEQPHLRAVAVPHMDDDLKRCFRVKLFTQPNDFFRRLQRVISGLSAYQLVQHCADAECILFFYLERPARLRGSLRREIGFLTRSRWSHAQAVADFP